MPKKKPENRSLPLDILKKYNANDLRFLDTTYKSLDEKIDHRVDYVEFLNYVAGVLNTKDSKADPRDIQNGTMIYMWSQCKEVYKFDRDFMEELCKTPVDMVMRTTLEHLPFDTFFIELNTPDADGCYVTWSPSEKMLHMIFITKEDEYYYETSFCVLPLVEEENSIKSIKEYMVEKTELEADVVETTVDSMTRYLNLVLYLTSDKADVHENPEQKLITRRDSVVRNTYREIRMWDVGERVGAVFRKSKADTNASAIKTESISSGNRHVPHRPHMRRAHWHYYRVGRGRENTVLRWVHACMVGCKDEDALPAESHEVITELI